MTDGPTPDDFRAREAAQAAMTFAFEARAAVQSYGTIFQALLNILKNSALFDESNVEAVFVDAAAMVDALQVGDESDRALRNWIREFIRGIAATNGIQIPPPASSSGSVMR